MILPSKQIMLSDSIFGLGGRLLEMLGNPQTVSSLWDQARDSGATFEKFTLALDMLYCLGLADIEKGVLRRRA